MVVNQVNYEPPIVRIASVDSSMVRSDGGKRKNFDDENNFDIIECRITDKKLRFSDDNEAEGRVPMLARINSLESVSLTNPRSTADYKSADRT